MDNVFAIKNEKNLLFVVNENNYLSVEDHIYKDTAIIVHLFYMETLEYCISYLSKLYNSIDIYLITSNEELAKVVNYKYKNLKNKHFYTIIKDNKGRDITALLIEANSLIKKYKYVCYIHDKKEKDDNLNEEYSQWMDNIWNNLIGNNNIVSQILNIFESNKMLGVLAPPDPMGDHFNSWYGFGWQGSIDITKKIADRLGLNTNISEEYPPITLGTSLWFRTTALRKLFDFPWKYDYFDDSKLVDANYLSYGIERIFAYVAQDAGYYTGEVMTCEYSRRELLDIKRETNIIFSKMKNFFPFSCVYEINRLDPNRERVLEYIKTKQVVYLYGCGFYGRFLANDLRRSEIEPEAFIVTKKNDLNSIDNIKVITLEEYIPEKNKGIVITVNNKKTQEKIISNLIEAEISDYIVFWE